MESGTEQRDVKRCLKCKGSLKASTVLHVQTGVIIQQFICVTCGRPWPAGVKIRPAIAA